jgi:hypothetical protein
LGQPLLFFNGIIPLFIQWVDIHVYDMSHSKNPSSDYPRHHEMKNELLKVSS